MELDKVASSKINSSSQKDRSSFFSFGKDEISSTPFFQPKLTINQPNDPYEQEADDVADKVMRMDQPFIQTKPVSINSVQRNCVHCEEEERQIQRKEINGEETTADNSLENYLGSLSSSGQYLPDEVRNFYEPRFGFDFSNVKVHTDSVAAKSAQSINALAYTSGNNIVFNKAQYSPNSESGKRLMGHELTHVVQQRADGNKIQTDLAVELPNPLAEATVLTEEQIQDAIRYNTRRFNLRDEWEISLVRDVLGLEELPAVVDEELINAIAQYQAENNITADGKIGAVTASRFSRELFNEGENLPEAERSELLRSSRRMGTRALRIRVNQPATTLDNLGSANYGVMWEIADREANGFVIQHVRITGNIQDCSGNAVVMNGFAGNSDYWEVWRVVNGRVRCGTFSVACSGSDDTFTTVSQNAGTRGTITERGQVSYYPDYLLNTAWITGISHPAGDLPHRATRPPFWNESETMRHQMVITYDDCTTPAVTATVTSTP